MRPKCSAAAAAISLVLVSLPTSVFTNSASATGRLDLLLGAPADLLVDLGNDDLRAFARETIGIGTPDPLPGSGDDGNLILQTHVRPPFPSRSAAVI